MTHRIPDPADPFEEAGLATDGSSGPEQQITGDTEDDVAVPGDTPTAVDDWGTTAAEEEAGEPLDLALSREEPEISEDDIDESEDSDRPFPSDPEERVGRIVEDDEGAHEDEESTAVAHDVGTDFGGFSEEERAMHIEPGP
jgi:Family of unknown function (DUF5709)